MLFAVLLIIVLLLLVPALPIEGNYQIKVVLSGSMEPSIKTGSVVVVLPKDDYNVGDVITFGGGNGKISTTHRIIEEKGEPGRETYITKGDANEERDLRGTRQREVLGKVLFSVPYFGYAVAAAQTPKGFALVVGIPALLVAFASVKTIIEEFKKIRKNKTLTKNNFNEESQEEKK